MNTNAIVTPVTQLAASVVAAGKDPTTAQNKIAALLDGAHAAITTASAPAATAIYASRSQLPFVLAAVVRGEPRDANAQAAVSAILLALANGSTLQAAVTSALGGDAGAAIVRTLQGDLDDTEANMDDMDADLATYAYQAVGPNMKVVSVLPTDGGVAPEKSSK